MNKDELMLKIREMKVSAEAMDEPDKTFAINDANQLEIELLGMSASDVAQKMDAISLPDIQEMNSSIQKSQQATQEYSQRVNYLNSALNFVKGALNIVV